MKKSKKFRLKIDWFAKVSIHYRIFTNYGIEDCELLPLAKNCGIKDCEFDQNSHSLIPQSFVPL